MDMEPDSDLAPALERVTASVAETQRRRLQLERELGEAQSVIATLKSQSGELASSLRELRAQLDSTMRTRAEQDKVLVDLSTQKEAALKDLDALRSAIQNARTERERIKEAVSTAFSDVKLRLEALQSNLLSTGKAAAAMAGEVGNLRDRVAALRESTDHADRQLAEVQHKTAAVNDAVDLLGADATQLSSALDDINKRKQAADATGTRLEELVETLESHRTSAERAADSMRQVIADHRRHTEALSAQIEAISRLVDADAVAPAAPAAEESSATSAPPPVITPSPASVNGASTPAPGPASGGSGVVAQPGAGGLPANPFPRTHATVKLLASEQFISLEEESRILRLLESGEVNKVVRSLWSRAVGGATPGVYRLIIADALNESGDFKAAMTFYNQALATRQLDPFLIYLAATSLFTAAKSEDALKLAKLLARDKAGKTLSRNIEAIYYLRSGKLDEAERRLAEALAAPGSVPAHYRETLYNMATLQARKGDTAASMSYYEKLQASSPGYRDVPERVAALQPAGRS